MHIVLKISCLILLPAWVIAQSHQTKIDSLHRLLQRTTDDTMRMDIDNNLGFAFTESDADSALFYYDQAIVLSDKLGLRINKVSELDMKGYILSTLRNYPRSLATFLMAKKIAGDPASERKTWHIPKGRTPRTERLSWLGWISNDMGLLYHYTGNLNKEFTGFQEAKSIAEQVSNNDLLTYVYTGLAQFFVNANLLDSALFYEKKAEEVISYDGGKYGGVPFNSLGEIYQKKGEFELSRNAFAHAIKINREVNNLSNLGDSYLNLSGLYGIEKKPDSSICYARNAAETYKNVLRPDGLANAYHLLYKIYDGEKKTDSAFSYLQLATALNDSLRNVERKNLLAFQNVGFDEQQKVQQLENEKIQTQDRIRAYLLLGGMAVLFLLAIVFYRNNRQKQKAKLKIEKAYENLQSTQQQLIQSEKMASLGELTAGIAHEIQNPLNFVNNFSEVNKELVEELSQAVKTGNPDAAIELLSTLKENEDKINRHGKRADAIVKGMLQHSQSARGQKERADINALAEEYLRLAYHGLMARDPSFKASMKTDFDRTIGKIDIIPQDVGRVLQNFYNNAFYAVNEKRKSANANYEPAVLVSTKRIEHSVEIHVKDNGTGIPANLVDKVFQPFFTTKPTGQGTGLGLSISYDIAKAHGGDIAVNTKEGEFTEFILQIPAPQNPI